MAWIAPPTKFPWWLRIGLWVTKRISGRDLLPPRLLGWYPRAALSSGVLEALITHQDGRIDARLLKLVRLTVSFTAGCPFCVDMNGSDWQTLITPEEMDALQGRSNLETVRTFKPYERLAVRYARLVSATPLAFPDGFADELNDVFSEREIVILASTAAQVNYWTRLIQALGCPPEGFMEGDLLYLPYNPVRGGS